MTLTDIKMEHEKEMDLLATNVANLFKAGINWKLFTDILCKANLGEPISPPPLPEHKKKTTSSRLHPPVFKKYNSGDWVRHFNENHEIKVTEVQVEEIRDYLKGKISPKSLQPRNFIDFDGPNEFSFSIDTNTIKNLKGIFRDEYLLFKCLESYAAKPSESGETSA